jgi:hypothetical protein
LTFVVEVVYIYITVWRWCWCWAGPAGAIPAQSNTTGMKTLQFGEFIELELHERITARGLSEQKSIAVYGDMLNRKRRATKLM